ncbi:ATP-binding protein [Candidatus Shapirobacteria bacterium]|nr:ATP-binding protein [Candidatus Shapirobacteria bacterium]
MRTVELEKERNPLTRSAVTEQAVRANFCERGLVVRPELARFASEMVGLLENPQRVSYKPGKEFVGAPGIGKTTHLESLREACATLGIPRAWFNFNSGESKLSAYSADPCLLVEDLTTQLAETRPKTMLPAERATLDTAIACYRDGVGYDPRLADGLGCKLGTALLDHIRRYEMQTPVAIFIDATQRANPAVIGWMGEYILPYLSQSGRCLFVFAGQVPVHWRSPAVRWRVTTEKLGAFAPELTQEQCGLANFPGLAGVAGEIQALTGGHPLANAVVLSRLRELATAGEEIRPDALARRETELLNLIGTEVVDSCAFREVRKELADACRAIALVRRFGVGHLRAILPKSVPFFADYPQDSFGGLLALLHATHLIGWNDADRQPAGYGIDPALRHLIALHTQKTNPALWATVNQGAAAVYEDYAQRIGKYFFGHFRSDNRIILTKAITDQSPGPYLVEALYHRACLGEDSLATIRKWLTQFGGQTNQGKRLVSEQIRMALQEDKDLRAKIGEEKTAELMAILQRT